MKIKDWVNKYLLRAGVGKDIQENIDEVFKKPKIRTKEAEKVTN